MQMEFYASDECKGAPELVLEANVRQLEPVAELLQVPDRTDCLSYL